MCHQFRLLKMKLKLRRAAEVGESKNVNHSARRLFLNDFRESGENSDLQIFHNAKNFNDEAHTEENPEISRITAMSVWISPNLAALRGSSQ